MLPMFLLAAAASTMAVPPGEQPVDPYQQSDANAGAAPFEGTAMWRAFHEKPGVDRLVDNFVDRITKDPAIAEVFKSQDIVRLRRTLKEQFCYILNGGCAYTGRDMKEAHKELGIQMKDMNVLVMDLQKAMNDEKIAFLDQNRFLAKLAPMKRDSVTR